MKESWSDKIINSHRQRRQRGVRPGYEKKKTKKMFGKTYNNCVKKEEVEMRRQKTNQDD